MVWPLQLVWCWCDYVVNFEILVGLIGNFGNAGAPSFLPNFAWGAIFVISNLFRTYFNVNTNAGARI